MYNLLSVYCNFLTLPCISLCYLSLFNAKCCTMIVGKTDFIPNIIIVGDGKNNSKSYFTSVDLRNGAGCQDLPVRTVICIYEETKTDVLCMHAALEGGIWE